MEVAPPGAGPGSSWWKAFGEGAVVMLANPEIAAFVIAFYPQFVPADRPLFATTAWLAAFQVGIGIVLCLGLAAVVGRAGVVPAPGDPAAARRGQRHGPAGPGGAHGGGEPSRSDQG